jgi:mannose-1-phosphate guanylyltransferase
MKQSNRIAVIMAGGAGERFWPVSRRSRPKQLLRLTRQDCSLLEEAVERVAPLFGQDRVFIATGKSVEAPIRASGALPESQIWVEPDRRNTLGALCWVAAQLLARGDAEATLAVLTADHRIGPEEAFRENVAHAMTVAEQKSALVTIGIRPDRPETGFGYIEYDAVSDGPKGAFRALSFREKPDLETAQRFLEQGNFLWNSGMFFWTLPVYLRELEAAQPEAARLTREMADALGRGGEAQAAALFAMLPNISVDFALMEKAQNVMVVPSNFEWDDVGAWDAIERSFDPDAEANVSVGDAVLVDSRGSIVYNDCHDMLTAVLGMEDALGFRLGTDHDRILGHHHQRVREIVQRLKESKPELT